ncbi:hypothetical protein ACFWTE_11715 [Nocardiopsis sp. NPDC058631]
MSSPQKRPDGPWWAPPIIAGVVQALVRVAVEAMKDWWQGGGPL